MKRRSGIVRRPAAPDSASAASERCRGQNLKRGGSTNDAEAPYVRHASAGVTEPRQVGPVVHLRVVLVVLRVASIDSTPRGGRERMTPKRTRVIAVTSPRNRTRNNG
jgi:hypothetical protein